MKLLKEIFKEIDSYPSEPKLIVFGAMVSLYKRIPGFGPLVQAILNMTPDVPRGWGRQVAVPRARLFLLGYVITFIFCFLITALLCQSDGVLHSKKEVQYRGETVELVGFLDDRMNVFFYTILNPTIMGCSVILWVTALGTWRSSRSPTQPPGHGRSQFARLIFSVTLITTISTIAISNYIHDVASRAGAREGSTGEAQAKIYWFQGSPESANSLQAITVHYMIINFVILAAILFTVGFFITAARDVVKLGAAFEAGEEEVRSITDLARQVSSFVDVYVWAKALVALHVVHFAVWTGLWVPHDAQLSQTENKWVEFLALAIIGIFFVAVPRYYLESEWYKAAVRSKAVEGVERVSHDIRGKWTKLSVHFLDSFFLGGFISSVIL